MIIRCIAIDDEPLALQKITNYISRVPYLKLEGSFGNPMDGLMLMMDSPVDLIFLDIQMDQLTGIQFLEVVKGHPGVILTTAYDQFALKGFEYDVIDYLLKPIGFERFLKSVNKAYLQLQGAPASQNVDTSVDSGTNFLFIKEGKRLEKIAIHEILYIEGMREYLRIQTAERTLMTLMSFSRLTGFLPGNMFCRIHKSYMVAIGKIRSFDHHHVWVGNTMLPIGDNYRMAFFEVLNFTGISSNERIKR